MDVFVLNVSMCECLDWTGVLKEVLNSTASFPPCSTMTCFGGANGLQEASGKALGMCWSFDYECLI